MIFLNSRLTFYPVGKKLLNFILVSKQWKCIAQRIFATFPIIGVTQALFYYNYKDVFSLLKALKIFRILP